MTHPSGWSDCTIGEIARVAAGVGFPVHLQGQHSGDLPFYKVGDISRNYKDGRTYLTAADHYVSVQEASALKARPMPVGTTVFAKIGAAIGLNRRALLSKPSLVDNNVMALIPIGVDPEYLFEYMRTVRLAEISQSTTVPSIRGSDVASLPFPLPPLAEQRRIVAKLQDLLARARRARAALESIPPLLERFRQSVLATAFDERWPRVELKDLATEQSNAICAGPFGTIFKAKDFRDTGVPIIFLRHVAPGVYRGTHKPGYMDRDKWTEMFQPYSVYGGELLVTKLGDPPGACAIFPSDLGAAMVTPDVIKMTVADCSADPRFLMHYLNSANARTFALDKSYGVTRSRINLSLFRRIPVPCPPLEVQRATATRLDEVLAGASEVDQQVKKAKEQLRELESATLSKAFRGELVPQDPSDEPASVLLERIRAEREASGGSGKKPRGRGRGKTS